MMHTGKPEVQRPPIEIRSSADASYNGLTTGPIATAAADTRQLYSYSTTIRTPIGMLLAR